MLRVHHDCLRATHPVDRKRVGGLDRVAQDVQFMKGRGWK